MLFFLLYSNFVPNNKSGISVKKFIKYCCDKLIVTLSETQYIPTKIYCLSFTIQFMDGECNLLHHKIEQQQYWDTYRNIITNCLIILDQLGMLSADTTQLYCQGSATCIHQAYMLPFKEPYIRVFFFFFMIKCTMPRE